ncbi:MAG TPA: diaminopimelate decarboxylase [Methanomassiliicoccales archaeon]|nr:diaminopimelate decarboxylase [Methanomassiliicoccales archaeon]
MRKFENDSGKMVIGGVRATEIAERYGTPVYVTEEKAVRENYRRIRDAFKPHMPVRVHFACKANSSLAILRILQQEGSHIDAVSIGEVDACLRAGFPPSRILYTGVNVSSKELAQVASRGVMINIDSFSELRRLAEMTTEVQISFRVNPGVGAGHHAHVVTGTKSTKFGVPKEQIIDAYDEAMQLGFMPFGLHAHIGAGVQDVAPFAQVTEVLVGIANELEDKLGLKLKVIDIGGGVGIPYRPEDKPMDVDAYAKEVTDRIKGKCSADTVAIEPGRYIIADTTVLLASVVDVKETPDKKFLGTDAGFNTLIRPAFYGSYHHVAIANKFDRPGEQVYDVVGPICESGDFLAKDRMLPKGEEGDLVAVYDAGAYGFTMSSTYNMRPRCREVLVKEGTMYLIREAETVDDLLRHERIPARLMI